MSVTLGLDLGPNSVGWALVDEENERLIDCGVRVFPEGVDNFESKKEMPRNESRRLARGMRRQIRRRSERKRRLREALVSAGLFPSDPAKQAELYQLDPYELRARALNESITPRELGRIFLHLNQRRGFLSNRKKESRSSEVKGMLAEINELDTELKQSGCRTIGEYLYRKAKSQDSTNRIENDNVRRRHTMRRMLIEEFDAIWKAQATHVPELLTEKLRHGSAGPQKQPCKPCSRNRGQSRLEAFGIQGIIFFQRPMYWPPSVVGLCELEPKQKRCPRVDRRAQRFRMLQEVNNLRYIDPLDYQEKGLNGEQRRRLLEKLSRTREMSFDKIRKILKLPETAQFSLERGKRSKIQGMITDAALADKKAIGSDWYEFAEDKKDRIVELLVQSPDDDETQERLLDECKLTPEQADAALAVELPSGYIRLSLKGIRKLLPHLEQGLRLMGNDETDSAMHAAGYMRRDQLQRRVFDRLPDPERAPLGEARIGDITSPVVKRAIVELRKVVNAILREYGKPDAVHVEMARTVRQGPRARREYAARIREIEAGRDHAAEEIRKLRDQGTSVRVNRDSILQYLLWEQQDYGCVYCGDKISQAQLFGGDIAVDHILPYSRCLDDSQMNKVVCHSWCNAEKGSKTPYEWLADSQPARYEEICRHALSLLRERKLPYRKYRRLLRKELKLDNFIARQLTATAYIARATAEYLRCLFEHQHDVLGLKGELTAELRRQWGLNDALRHDGLDLKTREDHRHHVIDAVIVAMTNRSRLRKLSLIRKAGIVSQTGETLDSPWPSFRDDVIKKVNELHVSHRPQRKVAGALHEDTFYGPTKETGVFVERKPVEALSANEVPLIRDDGIRRIITNRLAEHGIDVGRGKRVDARRWREAMSHLAMPSGVPIKRVRLLRKDQTIRAIREGKPGQAMVKPGATHHLELFEWDVNGKRKRDAVFVTMLEATIRVKAQRCQFQRLIRQYEEKAGKRLTKRDRRYRDFQNQAAKVAPVIRRTPPEGHPRIPPDAKFMFSLSRGEMVLADWKGKEKLLVYKWAASTQGQIYFAAHTDARRSADQRKFVARANTLNGRKVIVDPLGRIRWAND